MAVPYEIVETQPWHIGQMARRLRHDHLRAVIKAGMSAHRELKASYEDSSFRRSLFVAGRLVALGGVRAPQASLTGYVWLALSEEASKYPILLVKLARQQLDEIMSTKRELATTLLDDDPAALRLAVFLGFHVQDEGDGSRASSRRERQRLSKFLETCYDRQVQIGTARAIAVGYHQEEAA